MSQYAATFWQNGDEHHQQIARRFEEGITIAHPDRAKGECQHICGPCIWAASTVTYYEYRGESI